MESQFIVFMGIHVLLDVLVFGLEILVFFLSFFLNFSFKDLLVSGSRDGSILGWDLRSPPLGQITIDGSEWGAFPPSRTFAFAHESAGGCFLYLFFYTLKSLPFFPIVNYKLE